MPSVIRLTSSSGVLPMRSRIDSTFAGAVGSAGTRRKREDGTAMEKLECESSAAGDGGHDGNVVAFLQGGLQVLQESDVVAVDVDVDEAAHFARLVADAL